MDAVTDPRLQNLQVGLHGLQSNVYQPTDPNLSSQLDNDFDQSNFGTYALNSLANASVNHQQQSYPQNDLYSQSPSHVLQPPTRLQSQSDGSPTRHSSYAQSQNSGSPRTHADSYNIPSRLPFTTTTNIQDGSPSQPLYTPAQRLQQQLRSPGGHAVSPTTSSPTQTGLTKEEGHSSHFTGMKIVKNPPNLSDWRERLFNISGMVTMTEEEFQTYFPHVDNVYSHRSTQKYKRRPFVSHYWDCRLKGRPSGTPKSEDPSKKKRKRTARERDLCDVKIKITEYFPTNGSEWPSQMREGAPRGNPDGSNLTFISENQHHNLNESMHDSSQPFGVLAPSPSLPLGHPGANGARYFTIQTVNGSNPSNDGDFPSPAGPTITHKHTLEESDKIKKNSVQRHCLKEEKEQKRLSTSINKPSSATSAIGPPLTPIKRKPGTASGPAGQTLRLHSNLPAPSTLPGGPLTLFANSFCPFAQRIWIALEIKRFPYQYVEVIPSYMAGGSNERPKELLEICPEGVVPCLKHGRWGVWESQVCLEYLEDLTKENPDLGMGEVERWLLPPDDARLRAWSRLWVDHINRKILPAFYHLLLFPPPAVPSQASSDSPSSQPQEEQRAMLTATLTAAITALVNASHASGPFFLGPTISFVDVALAPWVIRLSRVLTRYRNYHFSSSLSARWESWVSAIESDERVRATTSEIGSYTEVYSDVGECGIQALRRANAEGNLKGERRLMAEMTYAKNLLGMEGFGMGGDVWGTEIDVDSAAFRAGQCVDVGS